MKKTVTINATNAVFVGGLPAFTGIKTLELSIGDVRMAILQNAIVTEQVGGETIVLTLENFDKDNTPGTVEEVSVRSSVKSTPVPAAASVSPTVEPVVKEPVTDPTPVATNTKGKSK